MYSYKMNVNTNYKMSLNLAKAAFLCLFTLQIYRQYQLISPQKVLNPKIFMCLVVILMTMCLFYWTRQNIYVKTFL